MTAPIIPGSTHKDDTRLQPMFPIERLEMAVGYGFRLHLPMVTFLCVMPGLAAETRLMMSQLWVPIPNHCWERHGFLNCTTWSPVTCSTTATAIIAHLFPITISFCNIRKGYCLSEGKQTEEWGEKSLHRGVRERDRENSTWWIWHHYKGPGLALRIIAKTILGIHWKIHLKFVLKERDKDEGNSPCEQFWIV